MKIRCAWCRHFMGSKPPFGGHYDKDITDGICNECLDKYWPSVAGKVRAILDKPETQEARLARGWQLIREAEEAINLGRYALIRLKEVMPDETQIQEPF